MKKKIIISAFLQFILFSTIVLSSFQFTFNIISISPTLGAELSSKGILWTINGNAICTADEIQQDHQICSDGAGGAIITWEDHRSAIFSDIYAQRIDSTGAVLWTGNGTAICTAFNDQWRPQICSDGSGGAIITWEDLRYNVAIYAQRINSTGAVLWTSDGIAICTANKTRMGLQICSDGADGAIITWQDFRNDNGSLFNGDIYAQKINSSGGIEWTGNGTAICTANYTQFAPQLCSDGDGGAIITWSDKRSEYFNDIYAQRIDSTGAVLWTSNGTVICTAVNDQINTQLCSDGKGGAIITWQDYRFVDGIYAQRINSTGEVLWTDNGTAICTAFNDQYAPQICSDSAGGAIITWGDTRNGLSLDIYAQKINSTGEVLWTSNGSAICTAADMQTAYQLSSDGAGGAIITWADNRSGIWDIYAQRINSTGDMLWTSNGTAICTAVAIQYFPQLCSDGQSGAIIIWGDRRNGPNYDIYAQRVGKTTNEIPWYLLLLGQGEGVIIEILLSPLGFLILASILVVVIIGFVVFKKKK